MLFMKFTSRRMFKEGMPGQEAAPQEQFGYAQKDADRLFEAAFRDPYEGSELQYDLPEIATRLMERAGYRVWETGAPLMRVERGYAFELQFQKIGAQDEDEGMMAADIGAGFSVDRKAGTVTFSFKPLHVGAGQPHAEEVARAMERMERSLTLKASEASRAAMEAFIAEIEQEKRERREGMAALRAFASTRERGWLTPADFKKNWAWLRPLPIPNVDEGLWEIYKDSDGWRFVWADRNEETGVISFRDVIEFSDKD